MADDAERRMPALGLCARQLRKLGFVALQFVQNRGWFAVRVYYDLIGFSVYIITIYHISF